MPLLIQAFRSHTPGLEVSLDLDVGNRESVFDRLANHTVDVAITGRVPEDGRLYGEPFAENEIVLTLPPRTRWHGAAGSPLRNWAPDHGWSESQGPEPGRCARNTSPDMASSRSC